MSYRLRKHETLQKAIRRIARDQIDKAIHEIDDEALNDQETIHQVRKRCKKLRALIRLFRPVLGKNYQTENAAYRDIATNLAIIRDEQSLVVALESLLAKAGHAERGNFDQVLENLRARRDAADQKSSQNPEVLLLDARKKLVKARQRVARWDINKEGYQAFSGGFNTTYKRGRLAMKKAFKREQINDFHEWRKRVKYHGHHLKLLKPLWPEVNKVVRQQANTLADILGNDHDLALLSTLLESEGKRLAEDELRLKLQAVIAAELEALQSQAWSIGQRLHAEKPKALNKRWKHYWQTWQTTRS